MVFRVWSVVMDADGELGLVDISNAPFNWSDLGKLLETVE